MSNLILDKAIELLIIAGGLIVGFIGLFLTFVALLFIAALIVSLIEHIVGTSHE